MPTVIDLQKAKSKMLSAYFKNAAAHHEADAETDEKCMAAHKAHAELHEGKLGKATDDDAKNYHKSAAAFHKTMSDHYEKKMKRNKDKAKQDKDAETASDSDDAEKVLKAFEIVLSGDETMASTDTDAAVIKAAQEATARKNATAEAVAKAADPASADAIAKAAAAVINPDPAATEAAAKAAELAAAAAGNPTLDKALETGLGKAITSGLERILSSPEFGKIIEEKLATMMLEKLGGQAVQPTNVRTFAVPRTGGEMQKVDTSNVDPQLAHLCEV